MRDLSNNRNLWNKVLETIYDDEMDVVNRS